MRKKAADAELPHPQLKAAGFRHTSMKINRRSSFQLSKSNIFLIEKQFQSLGHRGLIACEAAPEISITQARSEFSVHLKVKGSPVTDHLDVSVSQQGETFPQTVRKAFEKVSRILGNAKRKKRGSAVKQTHDAAFYDERDHNVMTND